MQYIAGGFLVYIQTLNTGFSSNINDNVYDKRSTGKVFYTFCINVYDNKP